MPYIPEHLTTLHPPCFYCKHLETIGTQEPDLQGWTCAAFPNGINYGILSRATPHTEPHMAQVGDYFYESNVIQLNDATPPGEYIITFDGEWLPIQQVG